MEGADDKYSEISMAKVRLDFQAQLRDLNVAQFRAAGRLGTPGTSPAETIPAIDPLRLQDN
jgi:hypothetical protein